MSTNNFLYELKNISKTFTRAGNKVKVLDEMNLSIQEKEFVSIMGPSGTGKSTLFNILGGLDRPDSGQVIFLNKELQKFSDKAMDRWRSRQVGFIFQFYYLIPVFTAYQNIEVPLLLTSLPRKERKRKIETTLSLMGMEDRAKHYPNQLSGGQQQRIAISRAIVTDPTVILADEPTGDLDAKTSKEIGKIIKQLNTDFDKTVILFTHDRKIAELGDRIINLDKGKVAEEN